MFNRKLKRRVKSLEEFFGIAYSPKDGRHDDAEHLMEDWGTMKNLVEMLEEWGEKKK